MPKIIKKLTEAEIRGAKPTNKPYKLYDEGGLRLLVRPTGSKVWQVPYKLHGKWNTFTVGQYCPKGRTGYIGTAEARRIRDEVKVLVDQGINPNQNKQAKRLGEEEGLENTFETIAREWHEKGTWVKKHKIQILRSLEADVFPYIGSKKIDQVTARDIIEILSEIEKRGALDVAKRICQRCENIFDYAIVKSLCENNPATGRSKFVRNQKSKPRPHLREDQLGEFLNKLDEYHGREYIRLAMKLLILTFVRPGELRNAKWEEFDWETRLWRIPAERMKMSRDHVVPLSSQALTLLGELKEHTGHSDYLFPSVRSAHKPISDVTLLKVLKLLGYESENKVTPHGFRHTASTILNERRFDRDVIERQLAHVDKNKVRGTYNHAEYLDERCKMMQWYAGHLEKIEKAYADGECRSRANRAVSDGSG